MLEALAVALGGALGSLGRWQLGVLFKQWIPNLPVGTFAANVVAGLIIGFVTGIDLASLLQPQVKLFLAVGLCGGLSTFSTFSNETLAFIQAGNWTAAGVNIAANIITCLVAVFIGLKVAAAVS
ncbi:CrcB protein [Lancefieldella parvula DSM 20469]|uniref:Fluoride-specific ion channel FluC n=1 Tax=Lancefieldella parvula (strain ATCC 33793 / DSM 20469 / CCUG 32760 / JCM 10300 / KCTC 3663 / VPI 0546 / 1246) TaxID=521095 RepID=C8W9R6_LANP1|nr:fluoride efflux transporter CrcB [Lancefieldella parvula]ACV50854.1 CrcB protein [Lancefieldella parvula DSM 20469]